jgi:hypothetical protein
LHLRGLGSPERIVELQFTNERKTLSSIMTDPVEAFTAWNTTCQHHEKELTLNARKKYIYSI